MDGIVPDSILWDRKKRGFNFEFSSKNINGFSRLFQGIEDIEFFKNLINLDELQEIINKKNITNAESKLLFRIVNAKYLINTMTMTMTI